MAYNIQEQVNSLEDQGIGALTQQLQQNPKLVVGIALENLQKDMQEAERAKQIGGGDTGLPIIDKKLASLSGGPSGQRDAMATAGPGLQQRGQQLQGQQLLKSLFQAAKTPGGIPAAMAQAGGGVGGMPTQRMAMGGIVGYQDGGNVQPIPALMDKYGSEMVSGGDVDIEVLLDAIRQVESSGNPNADSGYAYGAYQIDPTAGVQPGYGVEPIDVYNSTEEEQRRYARDYLKAMLGEFGGDLEPALQAYNVGPNALNQIHGGERSMPAETSDYYSKVMEEYRNRTMPQGSLMARSQQRAAADRGGADRAGSPSRNVNPRGRRDFSTNLNPPAPSSLMARSQQRAAADRGALRNDWAGRDSAIEATQAPVNFWDALRSVSENAGDTQDMINRADPAARQAGIDTNRKFEVSDRGIMSQVPRGPFRSDRDRFAQAIGPEAVEAIQQNQQRRAEAPKEYAPGVGGDLREIGDYIRRILGFKEGGQIKNFQEGDLVEAGGEQVIPLNSVIDDPGAIERAMAFLGDHKQEIALGAGLALTFVPYVGPAIRLAGGARGLGALKGVPQGLKNLKGFLQGKTARPASGSKLGRGVQSLYSRPRTSGVQSTVRGPAGRVSARNAEAQGLRLNREFAPGRASSYIAGPTTFGIAALMGGEDADADVEQTEAERFRETYPEWTSSIEEANVPITTEKAGDAAHQQRLRDAKTAFDANPVNRKGIMSRVGSALGSEGAQKFYSAMQDLSYAGGAPRGQEGAQMMRGLAARDAQNRELQALEDKVGLEKEMMELTERLAQMELTNSIFGEESFMAYLKNLAAELDVPITDQNLLTTAMTNYRALLGLSDSVGGMPGLTPPNVEAARAVIGQ